jgi:hypothetical protein
LLRITVKSEVSGVVLAWIFAAGKIERKRLSFRLIDGSIVEKSATSAANVFGRGI